MAFLGWIGHYLIVFAALAVCAVLGFFAGKKFAKKKTDTDK